MNLVEKEGGSECTLKQKGPIFFTLKPFFIFMLLWKLRALKLMESPAFKYSKTGDLSFQEVHGGTGSLGNFSDIANASTGYKYPL